MTEERNEPTNPAEESPELDARLNQIETATEEDSNVNEDFVHWLKTSFPIYVLAFAAAAGGYIGTSKTKPPNKPTPSMLGVNSVRPPTLIHCLNLPVKRKSPCPICRSKLDCKQATCNCKRSDATAR